MKKTIEKTKSQLDSQISHLKNIPSGSIVADKKSLLESVNLMVEEIGYHSEKNKSFVRVMKVEKDDDKLKYLNKELEFLLSENKKLKQKYEEVVEPVNSNKFQVGNEM